MNKTELKQTENLFKSLTKDDFSIFYATEKITNSLSKKAKKSAYAKDKVLIKLFNNLDKKL